MHICMHIHFVWYPGENNDSDFVRLMLFAFLLNSTFNLIIDYFGGLNKMISMTANKDWRMNVFLCAPCHCLPTKVRVYPSRLNILRASTPVHPNVCMWHLYVMPGKNTNKAWISNLWWGTYQCILLKVVITMVQAILRADNALQVFIGSYAAFIINLLSTFLAMYCLTVIRFNNVDNDNIQLLFSDNTADLLDQFNIKGKITIVRFSLITLNLQFWLLNHIFWNYNKSYYNS